ncbi:FAD-dependent tricarballylate dehydrogenase TcuA [Micromonospora sp. NPDC003197]
MSPEIIADVVVVGGGNAALTAAIAAAERGRSVTLLERAPSAMRGGNSYFTAGATRIAHSGLADLLDLIDHDERHERTAVPPYEADEYRHDMERVTEGRNDPALTDVLVNESAPTLRWLHGHGARYRLMYERQAYARPDGSYLFWGGLHVGNTGGGVALIDDYTAIARRLGVEIRYDAEVIDLIVADGRVIGVRGTDFTAHAQSVILAAGGFEADPERRRTHLGEGWENAKVRGTPFNDGRLLDAALAIGAARGGDWSTCHSVQWDAFAADNESNFELTNRLTRQSYPIGILVNRDGQRFLDEGADFRNYTYARYGRKVLEQPGSVAWQIFDAPLRGMLRAEEYDMPGISVAVADSIPALAEQIGVPAEALERTINDFNASIDTSKEFDPTVKDGRAADTQPPKSNWAHELQTAPYYAYAVTCGITFTFGGLRADTSGRVLTDSGEAIPGLFVCGEMLGGLFAGNYPGGAGLAAGAVFGRRAGAIA